MINQLNLSDESITIIDNFYGLIAGIDKDYAAIRAALSEVNQEQEDLLHELELSQLAAHERSIVANKLIEVRRRRRQLLNDFQIIEPALRFAKAHEALKLTLYRLAHGMRKVQDSLNSRQYTPRIRTDIKLYQGELSREVAE